MRSLILVCALAACAPAYGTVRYKHIAPRPPRQTVPSAPAAWAGATERESTAALVGILYDCRGNAVAPAWLRLRRERDAVADSTAVHDSLGQFAIGPLRPGSVQLEVNAFGHRRRVLALELTAGRLDTVLVQLTASPGVISDCVCPGGRGFGSQCCPPRTEYTCDLQ